MRTRMLDKDTRCFDLMMMAIFDECRFLRISATRVRPACREESIRSRGTAAVPALTLPSTRPKLQTKKKLKSLALVSCLAPRRSSWSSCTLVRGAGCPAASSASPWPSSSACGRPRRVSVIIWRFSLCATKRAPTFENLVVVVVFALKIGTQELRARRNIHNI